MNRRKWLILTALLLLATFLCACSAAPPQEAGAITVKIVATQDFGQELMLAETIELPPGTPAMTALERVADIETAYGGGFVNAINGISSGFTGTQQTMTDWFLYINGIQAKTGALDYELNDGDIQHWDFHVWSFRQSVPAIIGDFPEPLGHGYGGKVSPTLIAHADDLAKEADNLENRLSQLGINNISIKRLSELSMDEKESANLILLGTIDSELISELNDIWERLGFFAHFEEEKLVVFNASGEVTAEYGAGVGLIQATQNPWNPKGIGAAENVVWLISGTDTDGVKSALDALINHPTQLQYASAAVTASGEIIRIPQ
ncbi:MAG: DUF4430 domain-containing protein [Dehalococcoidia bacterium]|nr:MAG: DUF4430 domain-containing protein [Dehalococcoidia bacterium]